MGEPASCLTIRTSILGVNWMVTPVYWNGFYSSEEKRLQHSTLEMAWPPGSSEVCAIKSVESPEVYPRRNVNQAYSTVVSKYGDTAFFSTQIWRSSTRSRRSTRERAESHDDDSKKELNPKLHVLSFDECCWTQYAN